MSMMSEYEDGVLAALNSIVLAVEECRDFIREQRRAAKSARPEVQSSDGDDRIRYDDAARMLGVAPATLRVWVSQGRVPFERLGPRLVVFSRKDLAEWLSARRRGAR